MNSNDINTDPLLEIERQKVRNTKPTEDINTNSPKDELRAKILGKLRLAQYTPEEYGSKLLLEIAEKQADGILDLIKESNTALLSRIEKELKVEKIPDRLAYLEQSKIYNKAITDAISITSKIKEEL